MIIRCVYGSTAQEIMEHKDPEWCREHCGEISTSSGDCYWKFRGFGIDPDRDIRKEPHISAAEE